MDARCYFLIISVAIPLSVTLAVSAMIYLVVGMNVTDPLYVTIATLLLSIFSAALSYGAIALGVSSCR